MLTKLLTALMDWVEFQIDSAKRDLSALIEAVALLLFSIVLATVGIGFLLAGVFLLLQPRLGAPGAAFTIAGVVLGIAFAIAYVAKGKSSRKRANRYD